jgi:hypothetical protein
MEIISRKEAKQKNLKRYFTGKPCLRNHIAERLVSTKSCIECNKIHEKKYYSTPYGKSKRAEKDKRYKINNIEKIRERDRKRSKTLQYKTRAKEYNQRDYVKEKRRAYNKKYREENLEVLKERDRLYAKNVKRKNPQNRIKENIRRRILLALKNNSKSLPLEKLIGCEISFLIQYLENKFIKGMSWNNHGEWHIDHIKPCTSFDLSKLSEQKKCFHYKNLQPLWAKDNLSKGAKINN